MVVMHHALAGSAGRSGASIFEWILRGAATALWMGVDCFFVLSGFLITGILLGTRGRPHALRNFLARRALRTLPLYYATLFVCFVLLPLLPGEDELGALATEQIWFWLHLSNFYTIAQGVTGDGPPVGWMSTFWSLSVEEHFYLFWACTVMALGPGRGLWAVLGALLAGTLGLRVALAVLGTRRAPSSTTAPSLGWMRSSSARRSPCGFTSAGASAASSCRRGWWRWCSGSPSSFPRWGTAAPASSPPRCASPPRRSSSPASSSSHWAGKRPGGLDGRAALSHPILRACGKYSYAMYVFNKPILAVLMGLALRFALPVLLGRVGTMVGVCLAAALLSFAAALLSWRVLERPFLALKRLFETPAPADAS